jgi:hypothetical protein
MTWYLHIATAGYNIEHALRLAIEFTMLYVLHKKWDLGFFHTASNLVLPKLTSNFTCSLLVQ